MSINDERHRSIWRADVATALIIVATQIVFAIISPDSRRLVEARLGHVAWCLVALGWLGWRRSRASRRELVTMFVVIGAPLFYVFWLDEIGRAALRGFWIPFTGPKMAVIGVALLAPTLELGVVLIGLFTVETSVLALLSHLAGRREVVAGEPWVTFAYAIIALGLLIDRVRRQRAEAFAVRAQARSEEMARLARVALALRDLANTPLQTLRVNAALLRQQPVDGAVMARIDRALDRMCELNRVLARWESGARWAPGDESFDPLEVLGREAPPR